MKKYLLIFLFILFSANNFNLFSKRIKTNLPEKDSENVEKVKIDDSANNFSDEGLPEPKIIGKNPSDQLAVSLAKELSDYEKDSLPLLIATIQKTGFYIIDENQKILYKPTVGKGMGLAFYDFEVVGMYKLSRRGMVTSVGKISAIFGNELQNPTATKLGELMLKDLKTAANAENTSKRFWARLIIEIGKNFPESVDLLSATPETAQINIIQASLWERRLVGDLIAFASNQPDGMGFYPKALTPNNLFRPKYFEISFLNSSFSNQTFVADPCNYTSVETTEIDAAATALTTIHGVTLETVAEAGKLESLGKIGKGIGIANLVLNWAKLVAAASQIKGEIKVEQPLPLIRTKLSTGSGEKRLLTAKLEIKVNDLRKLNCFRLATNMATGLDFSMPTPGPLSEKPVSWELGGEVSFKGQNSSQTGEYEQVVYLLPLDGANRDHHKQETDANGESKIYLEGNKQKRDLTNEKVVPLPKRAKVRADVALKNMKDTKQETADIGGFGLGVVTGGGLIGILSALPEIGFRMKIPVVAVSVPIRDWTPCSEDWGGTINYKREFSQTIVVKANRLSNGNSTGDGVRKISQFDEAEITLNPRKPEDIQTKDPLPADIAVRGRHLDVFEGKREGDPCCGKDEGAFDTRFRSGTEDTYNTFVKKRVGVSYRGSERDYSLAFDFSTDQINAQRNEFYEVLSTGCPLEYDSAKSNWFGFIMFLQGVLPDGRYGERFVNSEGELLQGTKLQNSPDGAKITWSWALARCKD